MTSHRYKSVATKPKGRLFLRPPLVESRRDELRYEPVKLGLHHRFRIAYDNWRNDTLSLSRFDKITSHDSFVEICAMGRAALPLIFRQLAHEPSFVYLAAQRILGGTPHGLIQTKDFDSIIESWLEWSEIAGYRDPKHG